VSVFDVGLGLLAIIGAVSVAVGIIIWHAYNDWQKENAWLSHK